MLRSRLEAQLKALERLAFIYTYREEDIRNG